MHCWLQASSSLDMVDTEEVSQYLAAPSILVFPKLFKNFKFVEGVNQHRICRLAHLQILVVWQNKLSKGSLF